MAKPCWSYETEYKGIKLSDNPKLRAIQEESLRKGAEWVEGEIWKILIAGSKEKDDKASYNRQT